MNVWISFSWLVTHQFIKVIVGGRILNLVKELTKLKIRWYASLDWANYPIWSYTNNRIITLRFSWSTQWRLALNPPMVLLVNDQEQSISESNKCWRILVVNVTYLFNVVFSLIYIPSFSSTSRKPVRRTEKLLNMMFKGRNFISN